MTIKTIIIIGAVIVLFVGICSGSKGNPSPDRERGKIDHILRSAHDKRYNETHTVAGRQSATDYKNKMKNINNQYNNKKK